jgi:pyruvate dehydrogenase E2 component (dihydrolipoamide acetyltransferase)
MKINVVMPQLGESVVEGEVTAWLKEAGTRVERDEALAEVTTDKATVEIPAPASGVLSEVLAPAGTTVEVGKNIAVIESTGEEASTAVEMPDGRPRERAVTLEPQPRLKAEVRPPPKTAEKPAPPLTAGGAHKPILGAGAEGAPKRLMGATPPTPAPQIRRLAIRMTPLARRIARELDVDPTSITGRGAGGRITREDVLKAKAAREEQSREAGRPPAKAQTETAAPVGEEDEVEPLSPMRRRIAARLTASTQTIPQVTTVVEADLTAVAGLRERHRAAWEKEGLKLSYLPFIMQATVGALQAFPALNSSWGGDKIIRHKRVHLGMAVAVEGGLAVPVIKNADALSLRDLTRRLAEVADHARAGKLAADEAQGSTFTITNPGLFGSVFSTPLVDPPNAAILGIGRIAEAPVVRDGQVVVRRMAHLCLTYDHRLVDGETAITFLQHIRETLEKAAFAGLEED